MNNKLFRHGDINFRPAEKVEGELVEHKGSFVLAEGETTFHKHLLKVKEPQTLEIRKTADGRFYLKINDEANWRMIDQPLSGTRYDGSNKIHFYREE